MNYSCSWCIAAPYTKALAGRCFLFCSKMHTQRNFGLWQAPFIYFAKKFFYGSYLKQIWQHSNEQYSPQIHLSYVSSPSSEIFQHCQAFVKHGHNLCHLLFILAMLNLQGHNSTFPRECWQLPAIPRQGISFDRETEPGSGHSSGSQLCPIWMYIHISFEFKSLIANKIIQQFIKS